jgi:hypothetical protein
VDVQDRKGYSKLGTSRDRRAHREFASFHNDQHVEAIVCFCCARSSLRCGSNADVRWVKPWDPQADKLCGLAKAKLSKLLGLQTYLNEYGSHEDGPDLLNGIGRDELNTWKVEVPYKSGGLEVLCCPEDRRRSTCIGGCSGGEMPMCAACEIPICTECEASLIQLNKRPTMALANDLWIGYVPSTIHEILTFSHDF